MLKWSNNWTHRTWFWVDGCTSYVVCESNLKCFHIPRFPPARFFLFHIFPSRPLAFVCQRNYFFHTYQPAPFMLFLPYNDPMSKCNVVSAKIVYILYAYFMQMPLQCFQTKLSCLERNNHLWNKKCVYFIIASQIDLLIRLIRLNVLATTPPLSVFSRILPRSWF